VLDERQLNQLSAGQVVLNTRSGQKPGAQPAAGNRLLDGYRATVEYVEQVVKILACCDFKSSQRDDQVVRLQAQLAIAQIDS
jgi:hypothetical protein